MLKIHGLLVTGGQLLYQLENLAFTSDHTMVCTAVLCSVTDIALLFNSLHGEGGSVAMENDRFAQLSAQFLQEYYEERGIERVESEALAEVRLRAERVKESYKVARDGVQVRTPGPRRIQNNRRAAAAAKVRDEVYKKELENDIWRFEHQCIVMEGEMEEKKTTIEKTQCENEKLRERIAALERQAEMREKEQTAVIVDTMGETYEERRRSGFVCPSLFGDEKDVIRYGGTLPKCSQD